MGRGREGDGKSYFPCPAQLLPKQKQQWISSVGCSPLTSLILKETTSSHILKETNFNTVEE